MSENNSTKGREMKSQRRPTLFALSVVLLCTFQETTSSSASSASAPTSPSEVGGRNPLGVPQNQLKKTGVGPRRLSWTNFSDETSINHGNDSGPTPKIKEKPGHVNDLLYNNSRDNIPTVISERSRPSWKEEAGGAPICAYRVIEGGISGQLCFRNTHFRFQCSQSDCRTVKSLGSLVANILTNGSVLLQWAHDSARENIQRKAKAIMTDHEVTANVSGQKALFTPPPKTVFNRKSHRQGQGGFELSCWWNGSYTQFECATVRLASGCRDFLLTELHENIPYRICLRSLLHPDPAVRADLDCVEFTVAPSGMQDIVIAMTTVGGAICVMLVIICLLVAYITENIMSPATQHTYAYHTRSHH